MPDWNSRDVVRASKAIDPTEEALQDLLKSFDKRMQRLNDQYLQMMGEHLADIGNRNRARTAGASASRTAHGMWPSDVHRLQQIRRMNRNLSALRRRIANAANAGEKEIQKAFEAIARGDVRMASKILCHSIQGNSPVGCFIGGMPDALSVSSNTYLRNTLQAQARETAGRMENLANSTVSSDAYRRAVDTAVSAVQSGVEDYGSAIRRSIREAGQMGLRVRENGTTAVEYASGHTRRLDSAVRMNILDGVRHLNQSIMDEVGRQFGADGVEIDAHMLCAEDHLPYQGRQFSNADFEQIQSSLPRPFGEWNCRHSWHPILLGISQPTYDPSELQAMEDYSNEEIEIDGRTKTRYQWSQEMRRMETAIRQQKDTATLARYAGDDKLRKRCQGIVEQLDQKYRSVAVQAGLKPEFQRTYVRGFVDANPVMGSHPRIRTTGISSANLGDHEKVMAGMVGKADSSIRSVWNKNEADLRVLDAHYSGVAHCEGRNGVRFDIDAVAKGDDYKVPYQTAFHEFGHQIDYLSGRNGLPISYLYKNDLLSKTAMRESEEHLKTWFRSNFSKYHPNFDARTICSTAPSNSAIGKLAEQYENGLISIDQVLTNKQVFDTLFLRRDRRVDADYCSSIKSAYSERQRVDISDIFEPTSKINYPFDIGHRAKDPAYWYRTGSHATEIFAEMFSAEIGNHESLETIKQFYPETYKVFREILEVAK